METKWCKLKAGNQKQEMELKNGDSLVYRTTNEPVKSALALSTSTPIMIDSTNRDTFSISNASKDGNR